MNKIYRFLFSKRDFISFLSGLVVSGYVVEISANPDVNIWHWLAILGGLFFGFISHIFIVICKNYDENIIANKVNNPGIAESENSRISWDSITKKNNHYNRVMGAFPNFWMPIFALGAPITFLFSWCFLDHGNHLNSNDDLVEKERSRLGLIHQIDSLCQKNDLYTTECKLECEKNLVLISKKLDSLSLQIEALTTDRK